MFFGFVMENDCGVSWMCMCRLVFFFIMVGVFVLWLVGLMIRCCNWKRVVICFRLLFLV